MSTVVAGATAGALLTLLTGSEPGLLLGLFVLAATVVAALVVAPGAAYLIIPVPALAYLVAAMPTGYIHDRAADTSLASLAVSAVQWIADGFFMMTSATAAAIAITVCRWLLLGPGARRAYRDRPAWPGRSQRYRGAHGLAAAGTDERDAEHTAPGSVPAHPRHPA